METGDHRPATEIDLEEEIEPILRIDLTEEIIRRIKTLIARGKINQGSRLPPERDLARILGVGRPALRQALKALSTLGIIESHVGRGTFVRQSLSGVLTSPLDFVVLLNSVTLRELFEVRKAVEVELAALAAERATEEDLARIQSILANQKQNLENTANFVNEDLNFHSAVAAAAHNVLFIAILESLSSLMLQSRRKLALNERDLSKSFHDHEKVVREILKRNATGARSAMYQHLDRVYHYWEETQQKADRKNRVPALTTG